MSEIAEAYIAEVKLRGEVIQFLLEMTDKLVSCLTIEESVKLKQIEARYGRK